MTGFKDRRKAQRVRADLAINISGDRGDSNGNTIDISTNGVCFRSPYYMGPMTKVHLELPVPGTSGEGTRSKVVCDGIVVRVTPEKEDPGVTNYEIAVFFTHMQDTSLDRLRRFIKSKLTD